MHVDQPDMKMKAVLQAVGLLGRDGVGCIPSGREAMEQSFMTEGAARGRGGPKVRREVGLEEKVGGENPRPPGCLEDNENRIS